MPNAETRPETPDRPRPSSLKPACLEQLRQNIPEAMTFFASLEERTLLELSTDFRRKNPLAHRPGPVQDGGDLIALARDRASDLLSPAHGQKLARALEENFCALTANHLGADFHPQFVQGNLIFALHALRGNAQAIPVFSCGGVLWNNFAYPRGILLGRGKAQSFLPGRLPVLPDKHRRIPLSLREAAPEGTVRALLHSPTLSSPDCGPLTPSETGAARRLLAEVFLNPQVLARPTYGEQATLMNSLIWEMLFAPGLTPPPLVNLDMTLLSLEIIRADLGQPHSLIACLLEPGMPESLLTELNGTRGCWDFAPPEQGLRLQRGSFLFWGIDRQSSSLLPLVPDAQYRHLLPWSDDAPPDPDRPWVSLEPDALDRALEKRTILPGMLLSFAALALARGLFCCGGFYQEGYLTRMRQGVKRALLAHHEQALADKLEDPRRDSLCMAFLPLRCRAEAVDGEASFPLAASPVDILAGGGITGTILDQLAELPARDAFKAALAFHYEYLIPPEQRLPGWRQALGEETGVFLQ
ncbi:MAG: hypothetical protein LBU43_03895 [Candidatus Accumulibacter sp.]|jgi:hypothetical protein|nr:hypothetical protein [Accumulibacter sp.]